MIEKLKAEPGNFVHNAIEISDFVLIPAIALAIRGQFKNEEDFYHECIDILIEVFPHLFSDDGNFDDVKVETRDSGSETFYIYQPGYDYED